MNGHPLKDEERGINAGTHQPALYANFKYSPSFGIQFFYAPQRLAPRIGISAIAALATAGNIVLIILGATNPDPNSVGVHSPGDWMVVIAIMAGVVLWFATLLLERAQSVRVRREAAA